MTQNPEDIQRQIAALEAQLAALKSQTNSTTPTTNEGHVEMNNSESHGVNAGVITESTIYQFFGDKPPNNGEQLLQDYLQALIADCNRLRLDRMVEKRQTGGEHATTSTLKLQDVYTSLTTDGPGIVVDEHIGTLAALQQLCDQRGYQNRSSDQHDPLDVRELSCWDRQQSQVELVVRRRLPPPPTQGEASSSRNMPSLDLIRQGSYDPNELLTLQVVRPELAFDAIRQHRRLVLLGEPGSGKSTVLRYLAVLLARRLRGEEVSIPGWEEVDPLPIPIFCPLGQVAQALTETGNADAALWQTLGTLLEGAQPLRTGLRDYLRDAITSGDVILLCDGLDELPLESSSDEYIRPRRDIARAIQNMARTAPHIRIVLTSRVKPYHASRDWQMPPEDDWETCTIQPLAFGQVRTFIRSWYHALIDETDLNSVDDADARSNHLIGEIEQYPRIHPLVESPLLLTMLTILHYNIDRIPRDRATLYHECVQLLLERWEPVRSSTNPAEDRKLLARLGAIPGLELDQLQMVLHDLAFEAHNQPPTDDGRGLIDGEKLDGKMHRFFANLRCPDVAEKVRIFREVLKEDTGLLQAPDHDRYAFPHLTFQEYLAACYLVDQMDKEQRSLAYERWCSPDAERWREVLLLMMGRLRQEGIRQLERDGAPWLEYLLAKKVQGATKSTYQRQRDLVLAALSYAEIEGRTTLANWDMGVEERIEGPLRAGLLELLAKPDPQLGFDDRVSAGTVLEQIGDPRFPVTINEWRSEPFPKTFGKPQGYWCYVPAGTYRIGGWAEDEKEELEYRKPKLGQSTRIPAEVPLSEYWLARFPVTVAQFRPFVEVGYSAESARWWTSQGWQWKKDMELTIVWGWNEQLKTGTSQPAIGVTWYEAAAFVNWLDEQLVSVLPDGYQLRLPTEAEWEVAAAYDGTGNRQTYPWGESVPTWEHAVCDKSKVKYAMPVGCCPKGMAACGALDMSGNIDEWACSPFDGYPLESGQMAEDFGMGVFNVPVRGGLWRFDIPHIHCGSSYADHPDSMARSYQGFRVVVARRDGGA